MASEWEASNAQEAALDNEITRLRAEMERLTRENASLWVTVNAHEAEEAQWLKREDAIKRERDEARALLDAAERIGARWCQCGDDDVCMLTRQRDEARAEATAWREACAKITSLDRDIGSDDPDPCTRCGEFGCDCLRQVLAQLELANQQRDAAMEKRDTLREALVAVRAERDDEAAAVESWVRIANLHEDQRDAARAWARAWRRLAVIYRGKCSTYRAHTRKRDFAIGNWRRGVIAYRAKYRDVVHRAMCCCSVCDWEREQGGPTT